MNAPFTVLAILLAASAAVADTTATLRVYVTSKDGSAVAVEGISCLFEADVSGLGRKTYKLAPVAAEKGAKRPARRGEVRESGKYRVELVVEPFERKADAPHFAGRIPLEAARCAKGCGGAEKNGVCGSCGGPMRARALTFKGDVTLKFGKETAVARDFAWPPAKPSDAYDVMARMRARAEAVDELLAQGKEAEASKAGEALAAEFTKDKETVKSSLSQYGIQERELQAALDTMSDLSQECSMKLQKQMERQAKLLERLSNLIKAMSNTAKSIQDNEK